MTMQPAPTSSASLLSLADPLAASFELAGGKAGRLAAFLQAGHPVPMGFVLTTRALAAVVEALGTTPREDAVRNAILPADMLASIAAALASLGGPVAVRSSGIAEDLAEASFAGQYETVLNVTGIDQVARSVCHCLASAFSPRVLAYRRERGIESAPLAILIQSYVPATSAGVAFTAHPVTGERGVVVISAVSGVGESLVSGLADAEEWEVRGETALRRRSPVPVLVEDDALSVAKLASSVAGTTPTDIEWALHDGRVVLLQARPMTALPSPVGWTSPIPGGWMRNFRLGEWLGAPVTPLFESWMLTGIERATQDAFDALFALRTPDPLHIVVNGWYFYGLNFNPSPVEMLRALPTIVWHTITRWSEVAAVVPPIAHLGFDTELARWRSTLLPAWRTVIEQAEREVDSASPEALLSLVQRIIDAAAHQQVSIVGVAGYAAKAEGALMVYWKKHLPGVEAAVNGLIVGADTVPAAHDVEGLDWYFPTLGEIGPIPAPLSAEARAKVLARRDEAEAAALKLLPPKQHKAFAKLVAEARRAHGVRLEQTGTFTLGHPVMRRALLRVGESLVARRLLPSREAVFFLTRDELHALVAGSHAHVAVDERQREWERQRRLTPPLLVGELTGMFKTVFGEMDQILHHQEHDEPDALTGMPGSPGRVTGVARVLLSVAELDRLQPGEILVAPVTTPMWTLAFGRAIAIVTDTGSVASHASIVAREHGIPAVVGTGTATARIVDGQRITVDGGRGVVRLSPA